MLKTFRLMVPHKERRRFQSPYIKMKRLSEVSSVANHILNNALHVYFLSNESNTLAQLTEVECLYDFSFNSFLSILCLHSIHFSSLLSWLLLSEEVLVSLDYAHEVCVEGKEDGGLEEYFEEIVLLLELLVFVFGDSISDEDIISLVDGSVVDHIPESDAEN